mgnify:CR=1 FL=1
MKFFLNLSFFILGIGNMMPAQSQIRTVQCYPVGSPFAEPVIELGSGQQLFFPDFVNVSPKNHLQIMGRYVDVVS